MMKRIIVLLLTVCMIFSVLSACSTETINVTDDQKEYAEMIYNKACNRRIVAHDGNQYQLNFLQMFKEDGKTYIEFMFTEKAEAKNEGKTLGGAKVSSYGMSISEYYEFTSKGIASSQTKDLLATKSSKKGMVSWDSNIEKDQMVKRLYKLTQYLSF